MLNAGAAKLKIFRGKRSLEAVSGKIGATRMAWHGWENGNRIPNRDYMPKLVRLVPGLDPGDFYRDAPAAVAVTRSEAA